MSAARPASPAVVAVDGASPSDLDRLVADFVRFLETGVVPPGLFAPKVFADLSMPQWRLQTATAAEILAVRAEGHRSSGEVRVERVEPTRHGFVIEFEERWRHKDQRWYAREMIRADVLGGSIVEMAISCTGDWDEARQREHADAVRLLRP